jgi:hypothetical protein
MALSGFKSLLPARFRRAKTRNYVSIPDLAPYGATGLRRALTSPMARNPALFVLFSTVWDSAWTPAAERAAFLPYQFMGLAGTFFVFTALWKGMMAHPQDHAIDKSGYGGGDPEATKNTKFYYAATFTAAIAGAVFGAVVKQSVNVELYAAPYLKDKLAFTIYSQSWKQLWGDIFVACLATAVTARHAFFKLHDKKWIVTKAPMVTNEEKAEAPLQAQAARPYAMSMPLARHHAVIG